ncbi:hypothetical protein Tsubulata_009333 [Turnera subulata]|uniref:C2H2-type domain-containing protein n=1 Tax=Turnera subulata TaxID=218843 RepID=A0A9Q0GDF4_9ROSI|nr:hypothetical protein Tsubulata_009333 [Turnera subulata]
MAPTEIGLLSLTHLQKLPESSSQQSQHQNNQLNPSTSEPPITNSTPYMWNPKQATPQEDDDSWEVRAFAEDTGNIMGTTWPPRSYTCTFCRREFRSAQALGGHMNVHRRDRARLHQTQPPRGSVVNHPSVSTSSSAFIIPAQDFPANSGLCLLYQLPNPSGVFTPTTVNACGSIDSPSTLLSISPFPPNNLLGQPLNFPVAQVGISTSSHCYPVKAEPPASSTDNSSNYCKEMTSHEEVDLELRLGQRSTATSPSSS